MRLLLDTCSFLWYVTADDQLPAPLRDQLRLPANDVWLSVGSYWEICVKHSLGRLSLPDVPERYVPSQRQRHGFLSLPLQEEAVSHLQRLPNVHRDPFDRMLVCQAIEAGLTIVTPDPKVRAYPVKTLWPG
ncbi:MAG: type II toxin-antitoxin system VapC family toxin [Armatimonadetes bacterium]|nr:type II toxin-antitoxin system VapC family toxin [Armatimonadota bacterium]